MASLVFPRPNYTIAGAVDTILCLISISHESCSQSVQLDLLNNSSEHHESTQMTNQETGVLTSGESRQVIVLRHLRRGVARTD